MSQIHILDGQNDLILDYVQADDIIDDSHIESLEDTLETYDFIAIGNRSYTEYLEKRNRLIIPDEDGSLIEFVVFEVARYKDSEGHKVQAFSHASYLELKKANIIYPDEKGKKRTASQHAGFALNDTGWQVGTVEASGEKTLSVSEHTSPYEFLKHIAQEYGVELRFRVEHDGKQITGRYVDLLQRVGEWRGREVEFGRDLDGIRRVEKQDIVTALLGLGPEVEDGSRIEVFVEDLDALQRWGRVDEHGNLKHLVEPYEIESERTEMTEKEARQYTKTALNKRINTQVTYECTIVDLENVPGLENEKVRFGDTIRIKDTSFVPPLYLEARVFEQERSIKTTAKKDIKLGDFIEYTEEDVNSVWKQLKEQIKNRVSYYEMVEYTYDKLTIDDKDETYFEEGKFFAEAVGIDAKGHADFVASNAESNAKDFAIIQDALIKTAAEGYADQKAESALDQAKMYAVAKTVYENKMKEIAEDIGKKAPIEYVDGQLKHAIDGLVIGGRNYVLNSSFTSGIGHWSNWGTATREIVTIDNIKWLNIIRNDTESFRGISQRIQHFEKDTYYTISFLAFKKDTSSAGARIIVHQNGDGNNSPQINHQFSEVTTEPKRYSYTFKSSNLDKTYFTFMIGGEGNKPFDIFITEIKFEKGNKETDYSTAPEDMFSEIEKKADGSTVYTIEQVDNKFNNYVGITQYTTDQAEIVQGFLDFGTRIAQNETAIGLKADDTKVNQINNSLTQKIGNVEVKADQVTTRVSEVESEVNDVSGRVQTAEGEIRALAGEVALKASETVVNSLENRVSAAEGELRVLPGQINAKVSRDGAFGELNLSPDKALLDFKRVKMTGELEAKHIKSLAGLNVNDQFVVDANGKVTIGNQRVTIDDKGIQIRRPDGAVAVDNGLMQNAYSVSGNDPHYMKRGKATGGAQSPFYFKAFQEYSGSTYIGYKGMLDGRGDPNDFQTYSDVRDANSNACVFQRYEYIHSARYFVISLQVASGSGKFSVHLFKDTSDNLASRVYFRTIEKEFSGEHLCIVDLGKPDYKRKEICMKFGWANSWGAASEKVEFRVQRVIQTDFV